jgi:hypothetical protein
MISPTLSRFHNHNLIHLCQQQHVWTTTRRPRAEMSDARPSARVGRSSTQTTVAKPELLVSSIYTQGNPIFDCIEFTARVSWTVLGRRVIWVPRVPCRQRDPTAHAIWTMALWSGTTAAVAWGVRSWLAVPQRRPIQMSHLPRKKTGNSDTYIQTYSCYNRSTSHRLRSYQGVRHFILFFVWFSSFCM